MIHASLQFLIFKRYLEANGLLRGERITKMVCQRNPGALDNPKGNFARLYRPYPKAEAIMSPHVSLTVTFKSKQPM